MKMSLRTAAFFLLITMLSCRSEFEKIRTSGDATVMFEEANKLFELKEYRKAITLYELIIPAYRGKREAEDLYYKFADAHFKSGRYILSSHYFKTFADTYVNSPIREDALYNSAFSYYRISPKHKLEQSNTEKAIEAFQMFANTFPDSEKVVDCNKYIDELRSKLEQKAFDSGKLYYHLLNYSSAIQTLENMLKDYPGSPQEEETRYLIARSSYDWAENSIFLRQNERYHKTIERCESYEKKHPNGEYKEVIAEYKNKSQQAIKQLEND